MNDQTERTSCAAGAAPPGMPRRHPLARLGLVLATLMLIDTAFGQADNIDPAEALSPDTSPALDQPALPAETSVAEAEPDSEEGAGGGEPLSPDYGLTEEQVAAYQPPHDPADDYFDAIDRIEGDLGPYATELSDLYLGLGQALIKNGDFEQARDAFHRGVMVERVNSGPNSPE
ncbi:MAG: hypothetical protein KJN94_06305, partial [Gammaproteobacteria bacterium]|nr:hypothetical protein [Gammaproteobacteria bacterium]